MTSRLAETKEYPTEYPADAVAILDAMSFTNNPSIVGSMSIRSQLYAGDYDGYEVVKKNEESDEQALKILRGGFQSNIKELLDMKNVYIVDCKAGAIKEWRVLSVNIGVKDGKIVNYNASQSRAKIDELVANNIITRSEADEARKYLKDNPTIEELYEAKDNIKFHTIRWSVKEILANRKRLRDGRYITLDEAFHTPGLCKLDVIGLVEKNRFTDFSMIYEFVNKGKVLNPVPINVSESLEEAVIVNKRQGNYFKALKRMYSLAKWKHNIKEIAKLTPILNSDLGRLYHIISDIDTLIRLLSDYSVSMDVVRYEIDQFKSRLSNIYQLEDVLKERQDIIGRIESILKTPTSKLVPALKVLYEELYSILQKYSKPYVGT
jgi:hypothetical protein